MWYVNNMLSTLIGGLTMDEYWQIGAFSDKLGKHFNTVSGWFKKLEEYQIHYVTRINDEKVYDELDLRIAEYIISKREATPKWQLDMIFEELPKEISLRPFPDEDGSSNETQIVSKEEFKRMLDQDREDREQSMMLAIDEIVNKRMQSLLEDRKHERLEERKYLNRLRSDALLEWEKKSPSVRYRRIGLLWKVENYEARERFILEYLDTNMDSRDG